MSYIVNARLQPHAYAQSAAARLGLYLGTRARALPPPRHSSHDIHQILWHLLPSLRNPRSIHLPTLARHQPRPRLRPSRLPRAMVIDIALMFIVTVTPNARRRSPIPRTTARAATHRAPIARARVIPQHRSHRARVCASVRRTPRATHEYEPSNNYHIQNGPFTASARIRHLPSRFAPYADAARRARRAHTRETHAQTHDVRAHRIGGRALARDGAREGDSCEFAGHQPGRFERARTSGARRASACARA